MIVVQIDRQPTRGFPMRNTKQEKYELFLDGVQKKEDELILNSREKLLTQLATIVKDMPEIVTKHPNWSAKSLPKLRAEYTRLRDKGNTAGALLLILNDIAFHLSGWSRLSKERVIVAKEYTNDSRNHDAKANRVSKIDLMVVEVDAPQKYIHNSEM